MYFSILKISSILALIGSALCAPVSTSPVNKRGYNIGQLSQTPPPPGFGVGQYGSFNNVQLQVNDVNILQFALMLEVRLPLGLHS